MVQLMGPLMVHHPVFGRYRAKGRPLSSKKPINFRSHIRKNCARAGDATVTDELDAPHVTDEVTPIVTPVLG